jgi:DNA polymerase-4
VIAHFDLDAFYAGVAQLDDPSLRGKPLAISGNSRRAVVLTASYEARPFGVRSAMPLYRARQACPELLVVPPNFVRYRELSRACFDIFASGGRVVEGLSLDEAFVAVGSDDLETAVAYAREVRERIRAEVGLTVSAGVANQKMVAKIACDQGKPDGLVAVEPGTEAAYLAPLAVGKLWRVSPTRASRRWANSPSSPTSACSRCSVAGAASCANSRAVTIRAASSRSARPARFPARRPSSTT